MPTFHPDLEPAVVEALNRLETTLLTPLVSGELDDWVQQVRAATLALGARLREFIESVLHAQYVQIAKADVELLSRVEQMMEQDKTLLAEYDGFLAELDALAARVPSAERDELKIAEHRAHIEARGTALVLAIKKQRATAATWLSEAFYRDRGPVD